MKALPNTGSLWAFAALVLLGLTRCESQEPAQPSPQTELEWLAQNSADLYNADSSLNLTPLLEALGTPRILALGESSHGLGELYALKTQLVRELCKHNGYRVLAMESGLGDTELAYRLGTDWTPDQLRDSSVFGNFRALEIAPLYDAIQSRRATDAPIHYTGYDSQTSSDLFYHTLQHLLEQLSSPLAADISAHNSQYYAWYQACQMQDSLSYVTSRNAFQDFAQQASLALITERETCDSLLGDPFLTEVMLRTLRNFDRAVDLPFGQCWMGSPLRDEIMADNLRWLADTVYAGQKFIVWAHNAHVEQAPLTGGMAPWMGHLLAETYGDDYATIGLFCASGETYQHWTGQVVPLPPADSTSLEFRLNAVGHRAAFLPLTPAPTDSLAQWLNADVPAFELENGGPVTFVPSARFDAVICVAHSDPPTFAP